MDCLTSPFEERRRETSATRSMEFGSRSCSTSVRVLRSSLLHSSIASTFFLRSTLRASVGIQAASWPGRPRHPARLREARHRRASSTRERWSSNPSPTSAAAFCSAVVTGTPARCSRFVAPDYKLAYDDYQARLSYQIGNHDRLTAFAFGAYDFLRNEAIGRTLFNVEFHRIDLRWDHETDSGKIRVATTLASDFTLNASENGKDPGTATSSRGVRLRVEANSGSRAGCGSVPGATSVSIISGRPPGSGKRKPCPLRQSYR